MQCGRCRAELQPEARYCSQCGAAQAIRCAECGTANPVDARFCSQCGAACAGRAEVRAPTGVSQPGPERRHLTVMFCDLVGSTALAARLDPEDYHVIVNGYYQIVEAEVDRFGGYVARHVGDGVLVYFGYPVAHEDDGERAVGAGLAIAARVGHLDLDDDSLPQVRVGVATGLVLVDVIGQGSTVERTISGSAPNLASRLQGAAQPGTVVIASSTCDLVRAAFDVQSLGRAHFKGLGSIEVWQVIRPKSREDRRTATYARSGPLVGRSDETALLRRRWQQALAGRGCAVLISGDPGIGKSRIVQALVDGDDLRGRSVLYLYGSAHHEDSALHPFITSLGHAAGLFGEDEPGTRLKKAARYFNSRADLDPRDRATLADLVCGEVGGDHALIPQHRMERTLRALIAYVTAVARETPLVLVVEDLHWVDPSTQEALRQLVESVWELPLLLIATTRPNRQPVWIGLADVTLLQLNRLSRDEGATLIRHATKGADLPAAITDEMIERADGVPLFLEELAKAVVDGGARPVPGHPTVMDSSALIPSTLQASLLSRLDRLSAARELAQEAASIGREFGLELIAAVTDRASEELAHALHQLELAGLLLRRGLPPRISYYFKHALMQDAAYETLTLSKRQILHRRIADVYARHFQDIVETQPEILAHHLQRANLDQQAIEAWLQAANRTLGRGAMAEAAAQVKRGLALVDRLPDPEDRARWELKLRIPLGNALMASRGYTDPETSAAFERARTLCYRLGSTDQLMRIVWGQFTSSFAAGRLQSAVQGAEELLTLAEARQDAPGLQLGHASAGAALLHLGRLPEAHAHLRRALEVEVQDGRGTAYLYGQSGRITALSYLGLALALESDQEAGAGYSRRAVEEARAIAHPTTLCFAQSVGCRAAFVRGDADEVIRLGEDVTALAEEQGLALWRALGRIYRGWAEAQAGRCDVAIESLRNGLADYRATKAGLSVGLYTASLATLEGEAGRHGMALDLLAQARADAEGAGELWVLPEIQRRLGEALAAAGNHGAAETELRAGLAMADGIGMTTWAIRLTEALERL